VTSYVEPDDFQGQADGGPAESDRDRLTCRRPVSPALGHLHDRFVGDDPERQASYADAIIEAVQEEVDYLRDRVKLAADRLGEGDPVAFLAELKIRLLTTGMGEDAKGVGLVADAIRGTLDTLKGA
jgi:hypothetical protein